MSAVFGMQCLIHVPETPGGTLRKQEGSVSGKM